MLSLYIEHSSTLSLSNSNTRTENIFVAEQLCVCVHIALFRFPFISSWQFFFFPFGISTEKEWATPAACRIYWIVICSYFIFCCWSTLVRCDAFLSNAPVSLSALRTFGGVVYSQRQPPYGWAIFPLIVQMVVQQINGYMCNLWKLCLFSVSRIS